MRNRRLFCILIFAVLLSAMTLMLCAGILGIGRYDAVRLPTPEAAEVLPDHSVRFIVPLPEDDRRENTVLCFSSYNSIVSVYDGETLLLSEGAERLNAGRAIGHLLLAVPVPEDAWGKELTVIALAHDGSSPASIYALVLLPEADARLYPLLSNQFDFLVFLPVTLLALAASADLPGRPDMSLQALIRLADERMYRHKQEMKACR